MNPRFKVLAEESGFVFWNNEPHGTGPGTIDWSCDYATEFEHYSNELVLWVLNRVKSNLEAQHSGNLNADWYTQTISEFGLTEKIST